MAGYVDSGENETQAALREVFEESGLEEIDLKVISGFKKIFDVSHTYIR